MNIFVNEYECDTCFFLSFDKKLSHGQIRSCCPCWG